MKTSGRIVWESDDGKDQEKAARIICREKARTMQSIFQKGPRHTHKEVRKKKDKPLIFYLVLLALPLVGFAISLHIAAPGNPIPRQYAQPDNTRTMVMEQAPGNEIALPGRQENDLLRYDDYEEFWNIISEPDVPLAHKKEWVHRLFLADGDGAYAYFTLNIYDFSHDEPLQTAINEVCVEHGFPAIVIYDKAGIREELSGFFSRKWLLWILLGSPLPLLLFLGAVRFLSRSGIWKTMTNRLKKPFTGKNRISTPTP